MKTPLLVFFAVLLMLVFVDANAHSYQSNCAWINGRYVCGATHHPHRYHHHNNNCAWINGRRVCGSPFPHHRRPHCHWVNGVRVCR